MVAATVNNRSFDPGNVGALVIEIGERRASVLYELVHICARFDDVGEWTRVALPTAAHWIAQALDVEVCTAREWVRIGKALRSLPLINRAFEDKRLSYSKVRALTRLATPQNEMELVPLAESTPAGRLGIALASWSQRNEDPKVRNDRHERDRGLWVTTLPDGMARLVALLPPLKMAQILGSVDAKAMSRRGASDHASADASRPTRAQQRADGLLTLVTSGGASVDTEVVIHVRGDGCSLDDGTPILGSVVERVAPTSFIRALIHDANSRPINASGKQRHPSIRQKRVIKERDRVCIDCGGTEYPQYDHVPDFEQSKRTVVDELFLRCGPCHRRRHKQSA